MTGGTDGEVVLKEVVNWWHALQKEEQEESTSISTLPSFPQQESHTDYYGSLERLPLAPLRKKPPPYASRRQQDARRSSYLKGVLSSSTGDLTQAGNKTRVVNKSPGKDARGRTKDRGDSGLPPGCGEERGASGDVSSASGDATHVLSQHRHQESVLYGSEGRKCSDDTDHHISKPVREEYTRKYSNGGTEQHLKSTENSRDWHAIENKATEKHRHLDHKMQRERERAEEQNIEKEGRERQRETDLRTERGRSRLDKEGTGNKATERDRNQREKEATENRDREKYRDLNSREKETPEQDNKATDTHTNTNPIFTRERAKSEENLSNSELLEREGTQMNNSLKNYRQLAAIPDHTLVKWSRSKSLDDVTLNDGVDGDEGRRHVSSSGKVEYRKVDVCEYSDNGMKVRPALSVGKEGGVDSRGRALSVGKMDVDARNGGNGRSYASLSSVGKGIDGKNYTSSSIVAKKVDVNGRNCALSVDKVDVDGRSGPSFVEKVDYRKVSIYAEEKPHSTTSSPTSLSSPLSSATYSPKDNEEGAKVVAITDKEAGVFVATPVFLEGGSSSSSASPSPSASPPPLLLQGSDVSRNKLDSTDTKGREEEEEEGKAALSTLRREILHLTRLKEEIEQNLLRSQSVLKEEVTGLRQEHGALAATVEERERQLHSQQAEIQDLKGTIKQLQALVFTSDTETRLQRQASDLQELLREEKRHHLEETTQLRREVKLLSSQLREKDHQLERYRSSPSLASWSGEGVMGRLTKEWKTSLPDVRGGKEVLVLRAPVAERRKSFSGMSDSSGDGPASWPGSLERSTARSSDDVVEASYIAPVRSYTSTESCRISERPQVAPGRSNISVKSSRISERPPTDASMSKHIPVGSDMVVRSSRKSEGSPTGPSGSHLLSLRDTMPEDTQSGDEQGRGLVKTTLYVELRDYSKSGGVKEVPRGSHRSGSDDSPSSETPGRIKTRGHTEEGQRGKYLSRGGLEEDQREKYRLDDNRPFSKTPASVKTRGGSEMRPSDRTRADVHNKLPTKTQPVVTKPSQPSTVSLRPSRPSTSPPSPPQVTRKAGGNLTSPARQEPPISRVSGAQDSRPRQKALEDTSEGLGGSWQDPRGSRGVVGVRTSWMYKPVTGGATGGGGGGGGREGVSGGKRDVDVFRGDKKGVDACREERAGAQSGVSVGEAGRGTPSTSYISATLQCLFTVPLLREFFRGEFWQLRVQSEVVQAVADTFLAMESGIGEGRAIGRLHEAVGRRDKVFRLHQDPPAADLLSSLLAWLHHDLGLQAHPQMSSVVSRLFHGLRESLIVCPRQGILSSALESFNFVTLSVPGEGAWSLQELLGQRFRPQDMAWECQPCRGRHPCSHKIHMLRPPQVLVLFLRSPPDVATRVIFPDAGLSLALHHQDTAAARSPEYQLVGVVNRQGGEDSSLYSAYCRRLEDGRWGLWREGQVAAVSRKEVLSKKGAHLLFYLQCQQDEGQSTTHRATRGQMLQKIYDGAASQ